jgi:hypothetical protein
MEGIASTGAGQGEWPTPTNCGSHQLHPEIGLEMRLTDKSVRAAAAQKETRADGSRFNSPFSSFGSDQTQLSEQLFLARLASVTRCTSRS